jgi:SEC-C motif-containing protein
MRSRYSAYAMRRAEYIQRTTHPQSPHFKPDALQWKMEIIQFCDATEFIRLEILGYGENWVHFIAHLKQSGKSIKLNEKSRFERLGTTWRYMKAIER